MNGSSVGDRTRTLLSCLGVASRFRLVGALSAGERCVGDLALAVGLSQSCTTRHLQALERAGVVRSRREGRRVFFQLRTDRGLDGLLRWALPVGEGAGAELEAEGAFGRAGQPGRAGAEVPQALDRVREPRTSVARRPHGRGTGEPTEAQVPSPGAGGEPEPSDGFEAMPRPGDLEDYLL